MQLRTIPLANLLINHSNDRHGELATEADAIAWLFHRREQHMRNLAKDLAETGRLYEVPLVWPVNGKFIVFDGNRRVTCLKVLANPKIAPTVELREYFEFLAQKHPGSVVQSVQCHVEDDRDIIDDILFRRHTGSQRGVGQSNWDDRMKANFIARTGKGGGVNVAEEIEKRLALANALPKKKIPRSTLNRLLSAEVFRNRVGISVQKGKFRLTHNDDLVIPGLQRIAGDLANQKIVLGDIWDVDDKQAYLDRLEREGVLPSPRDAIGRPIGSKNATTRARQSAQEPKVRDGSSRTRTTLIPNVSYAIAWAGRLQRHREIWEELQNRLNLEDHPNAIAVLFRVLLELSVENYIQVRSLATIRAGDKLSRRVLLVAEDLYSYGKIDKKYLGLIRKFGNLDPLVSADTLNRYVHSPDFSPSPGHLIALWDSLANFIVASLSAPAP